MPPKGRGDHGAEPGFPGFNILDGLLLVLRELLSDTKTGLL